MRSPGLRRAVSDGDEPTVPWQHGERGAAEKRGSAPYMRPPAVPSSQGTRGNGSNGTSSSASDVGVSGGARTESARVPPVHASAPPQPPHLGRSASQGDAADPAVRARSFDIWGERASTEATATRGAHVGVKSGDDAGTGGGAASDSPGRTSPIKAADGSALGAAAAATKPAPVAPPPVPDGDGGGVTAAGSADGSADATGPAQQPSALEKAIRASAARRSREAATAPSAPSEEVRTPSETGGLERSVSNSSDRYGYMYTGAEDLPDAPGTTGREPQSTAYHAFSVGTLVERDIDSMWFPAEIVATNDDGTYDLKYTDDGNSEVRVAESELRLHRPDDAAGPSSSGPVGDDSSGAGRGAAAAGEQSSSTAGASAIELAESIAVSALSSTSPDRERPIAGTTRKDAVGGGRSVGGVGVADAFRGSRVYTRVSGPPMTGAWGGGADMPQPFAGFKDHDSGDDADSDGSESDGEWKRTRQEMKSMSRGLRRRKPPASSSHTGERDAERGLSYSGTDHVAVNMGEGGASGGLTRPDMAIVNEEDISMVMGVTECTREIAEAALLRHPRLETAIEWIVGGGAADGPASDPGGFGVGGVPAESAPTAPRGAWARGSAPVRGPSGADEEKDPSFGDSAVYEAAGMAAEDTRHGGRSVGIDSAGGQELDTFAEHHGDTQPPGFVTPPRSGRVIHVRPAAVDEDAVEEIVAALGPSFSIDQVRRAFEARGPDKDAVVSYLFDHPGDLEGIDASASAPLLSNVGDAGVIGGTGGTSSSHGTPSGGMSGLEVFGRGLLRDNFTSSDSSAEMGAGGAGGLPGVADIGNSAPHGSAKDPEPRLTRENLIETGVMKCMGVRYLFKVYRVGRMGAMTITLYEQDSQASATLHLSSEQVRNALQHEPALLKQDETREKRRAGVIRSFIEARLNDAKDAINITFNPPPAPSRGFRAYDAGDPDSGWETVDLAQDIESGIYDEVGSTPSAGEGGAGGDISNPPPIRRQFHRPLGDVTGGSAAEMDEIPEEIIAEDDGDGYGADMEDENIANWLSPMSTGQAKDAHRVRTVTARDSGSGGGGGGGVGGSSGGDGSSPQTSPIVSTSSLMGAPRRNGQLTPVSPAGGARRLTSLPPIRGSPGGRGQGTAAGGAGGQSGGASETKSIPPTTAKGRGSQIWPLD